MTINVNVHHYFHGDKTENLYLEKLNFLIQQNTKIMADLSKLEQEVSENKTVMQSAVTLLQGLKQKLDEAGTDAVKLKELSDELDSNTNALAEAVSANTPAEGQPTS